MAHAVITGNLPSATGSTDFTQASFGTPAGALVFMSNANTTNNPQDSLVLSVGIWDGTNVRSVGVVSNNAVGTSVSNRVGSTTKVLTVVAPGGSHTDYTISNITDGVRITMSTDNTGVSRHARVILFGADSADAGSLTTANSLDGTASVTSLSYEPDLVFIICAGDTTEGQNDHAILSIGVGNSALDQRCLLTSSVDGQGTSVTDSYLASDRICGQLFSGSLSWAGELTAVASNGFTITTRTAASGGDIVYWLALDLGGDVPYVGTLTTPTSTGDDASTAPGFEPNLLMSVGAAVTAVDTVTAHVSIGVGATDDTTDSSVSVHDEDNQGTTDAASGSASRIVDIRDPADLTDRVAATLSSFDANGWTRNYSAVHTSAYLGWDVAFRGAAAAAATPKGVFGLPLHGPFAGPFG